jgi:hypothetical protein
MGRPVSCTGQTYGHSHCIRPGARSPACPGIVHLLRFGSPLASALRYFLRSHRSARVKHGLSKHRLTKALGRSRSMAGPVNHRLAIFALNFVNVTFFGYM